jgi:hypothetical protein
MSDEEEQQDILLLKPNENVVLTLREAYQNHFEMIKEEQPDFMCRVVIQDQSDYGVVLPAKIIDNKEISFSLPEQLCIFNPNKTYLLKVEVVLETELVTPIFQPCQIDLNGLLEPEEEKYEEEGEENLQDLKEANKQPEKDDDELNDVLDAIAPLPRTEIKKTKVEDIVKQLDEEFVKNALWKTQQVPHPQIQVAPIPTREPEPPLNTEALVVKQKMKNLLRSMLG